jgi:adenylate cyclase
VRVVAIDDESLARPGQWPWPRATLAALVRALQDLGAASIALDVVFAEPDRSAPDGDRVLAAAFARGRVVTGFGLLPLANGARPARTAGFATIGGDPAATLPGFAGAVPNLPVLEEAASGHGSFTVPAGREQIVRRLPMLTQFAGELVPSLALEALRVAEGESTIRIRAERVRGALTGYPVRVGEAELPHDEAGSLWLPHTGPAPERAIPAWRVLDPAARDALRKRIEGSIVLIGTSAVGLADLRPTPLNPFEPGVNLHAAALEQIRERHFLIRPAWAAGAELAAAAGLALLVSLLAALAPIRFAALLAALALAAVPGGA